MAPDFFGFIFKLPVTVAEKYIPLSKRVLTKPQLSRTMAVTRKKARQYCFYCIDVQTLINSVVANYPNHVRPSRSPAMKERNKPPTLWSVVKLCTRHQQLSRCTRQNKPGHCARRMNKNNRKKKDGGKSKSVNELP